MVGIKGKSGIYIRKYKLIHSKVTKNKISITRKKLFKEGKLKIWNKDKKLHYKHGMLGKKHKKSSIEKMKKSAIGKHDGEKSGMWQGGISFEPYGLEFNNKLRLKIRTRDEFKCQECFITQKEFGKTLDVHHIDFNKRNNTVNNLITLCRNCHTKTQFNRDKWFIYYKNKNLARLK